MIVPYDTVELQCDYAFSAMHARLLDYGLCWIRGPHGRLTQIIEWESNVRPERREWTQPEIESAGRLHSRIIRMPLQTSLVLQVFYGEAVAHDWDTIRPEIQYKILRDLTFWPSHPKGVNPRIDKANRECGTNVSRIRECDFMAIRDRGIRMLCNGDRMLP